MITINEIKLYLCLKINITLILIGFTSILNAQLTPFFECNNCVNDELDFSQISMQEVSPNIPLAPFDYGQTFPEAARIIIDVCSDGEKWYPVIKESIGEYSLQYHLTDGVSQITGINGNTTAENHCAQMEGLASLGLEGDWYDINAVIAHERVHVASLTEAFYEAVLERESIYEGLTVLDTGQTEEEAINSFPTGFQNSSLYLKWVSLAVTTTMNDHNGPTDEAERAVVEPIMQEICCHAQQATWNVCSHCDAFYDNCN